MRRFRLMAAWIAVALLSVLALEALAAVVIRALPTWDHFVKLASFRQMHERGAKSQHQWFGYRPHRYLGYSMPPEPGPAGGVDRRSNGRNSFGLRGPEVGIPKPAGIYRILCLGGSTTYDSEIEFNDQIYTHHLGLELHRLGYGSVEVVNAAVSGYQSLETLIAFQIRLLDLDPDMILVYDNFNDIIARLVWPAAAYQGDGSGHTQAAAIALARWSWREDINTVRIIRRLVDPPSFSRAMLAYMTAYPETALTADFVTQLEHGAYPSGRLADLDLQHVMDANPPVYFERNLRSLVHVARGNGVVPVFHTFRLCEDKRDVFSHPIFVRGVREHNEVIRKVGGDLGVHLLELAEALPDDARYFADGIHNNPEGAALRARIVARHLDEVVFPALPQPPRRTAQTGAEAP